MEKVSLKVGEKIDAEINGPTSKHVGKQQQFSFPCSIL